VGELRRFNFNDNSTACDAQRALLAGTYDLKKQVGTRKR
jgi:hypothetical protein